MPKPAKSRFQLFTVSDSRPLTPNLVRLELYGDALSEYPPDCIGGYIKLAFDADGKPLTVADVTEKVTLRTYSIRALDPISKKLTVDFVLHGDGSAHHGPASAFARVANTGDTIAITGPGSIKSLYPSADWFLIAGDMSALPAIAAKLELQARAGTPINGYMVLELMDKADADCLNVPAGLELHTVINPNPAKNTDALLNAVCALPWRDGRPFAWCAAEFGRMQGFRDYVRRERGIGLEDRYVSSYWMLGHTDEGHKFEKRKDADR